MNKTRFSEYVKELLNEHSVELDSENGETTCFEQRGDHQELVEQVLRGGQSSMTIIEDGDTLGGITVSVDEGVDIEYRDVQLYNNSPQVEHLTKSF